MANSKDYGNGDFPGLVSKTYRMNTKPKQLQKLSRVQKIGLNV